MAADSSVPLVPATHMEIPHLFPGSWLQTVSALAVVDTWGNEQEVEDFSVSLSVFYVKVSN